METKICSKCKEEKELTEFGRYRKGNCGYLSICKKCIALYKKKYNEKNFERLKNHMKEYGEKNSEKLKDQAKNRYENTIRKKLIEEKKNHRKTHPITSKVCTLCHIEKDISKFGERKGRKSKYMSRCKECIAASRRKYRIENPEIIKNNKKQYKKDLNKISIYMRNYYKKNNEKIKKQKREYSQKKRDSNPLYNLKVIVRSRIQKIFKIKNMDKNYKTFDIIGCSPSELKIHIEKQFTEGMSWENHKFFGWHIDHKIPLDFGKTEGDVVKLCHYTNLQPLWWKDNLNKSNKIL